MPSPDRPGFHRRSPANPGSQAAPLSAAQTELVRQFVARVGGIENARRALEMLAMLRRLA